MKHKQLFLIIFFILFVKFGFAQLPYSESFETGWGIWTQSTTDNFDWSRDHNPTPTTGTGPSVASDGFYFAYIEATGHNDPSKYAEIEANFDFSGTTMPIISFDYHMFGTDVGFLFLYIYDGSTWTEVWNKTNNQGDEWHTAKVCLDDYANNANVKIRFKAQTQNSELSDIAIDNIQIVDFDYDDISHVDVTCADYADGSIKIDITGGFSPYEYSIDDGVTYVSDASTSHTFSGLHGGQYNVKVRSTGGCALTSVVETLQEPDAPDIQATRVNVTPCPNSKNGQITITATGNYTPYKYSIGGFTGTFGTNNVFNGLDTGLYQTAVKNSVGCIALGPKVSIVAPAEIQIFDIEVTDVSTCYGECNGSLKITAGGGNSPLEYSTDEGSSFDGNTFVGNLCAGSYRFIIKDSEGCLDTSDYQSITQPDTLKITNIQSTDVTGCNGDKNGSITLTATGGTGDIKYSIDNGFTYQSSNIFSSLLASTYHLWVRDSKNCTTKGGDLVISQPDLLVTDSVVSKDVQGCHGLGNGEIHIYAHGGTGTLTYSIDSGDTYVTSHDFTSLSPGIFYPAVVDVNGCDDFSLPVQITEPNQLIITNVNVYDVTDCYDASTGIIQIFASNGTAPYKYSIDGGATYQTSNNFTNLHAGGYRIAIKDFYDCEVIGDSVTISQPAQIVITDEYAIDVACYGANDGQIFVNATGGTGDLFYSIDGHAYPYSIGTITYQRAGSYQIKVRDENSCTITGSLLTIHQPDSLAIDSIRVTNVEACYADSTGKIEFFVSGGITPIKYSLDNGLSSQSSSVFDNLPAKAGYLPYIEDDNGCFVFGDPQTIGQPPQLIVTGQSHTDIDTCHGQPVGTISVTSAGGSGTIQYSIDNGTSFFNNSGNFSNLYAGTYSIKIKDAHDCPASGWQEIIHEPDTLLIDSIAFSDVVCNGQGNGTIQVYAHGGQPQISYSIDNGYTFSYSWQFNNLVPGTYDIVIKDNYNCRADGQVSLIQPNALVLDTVTFTDVNTCYGDSSGTITILAHGGSPDIKYSYASIGGSATDFQLGNVFNTVTAGSYYTIIKDENGCTQSSEAFQITQPTAVQISTYEVNDISCHGLNDGNISVQAIGGAGNYKYSIDAGSNWQIDSVFNNLYQGSYVIKVKDSNDCKSPYPITVNIIEPTQLIIYAIDSINPACYGYTNGQIVVYPTGGTGPYMYYLNDTIEQISSSYNNLSEGEYWVTVVDDHHCVVQSDTMHLVMPVNSALFNISVDTGCSPLSVDFQRDSAFAIFNWQFGDGHISYTQDPTHIYVNKTDSLITFTAIARASYGNCKDSASQKIVVYNQPNVAFGIDTSIHFYPDTVVDITNLNTTYQNYQWDFGDGSNSTDLQPNSHIYPNCGTYSISLIAENVKQCADTTIHDVQITSVEPQAGFSVDDTEGCPPLNVYFSNTSSNAQTFEWIIDDNVFSTDTSMENIFEDPGNIRVMLKASGYCNKVDYDTAYINVYSIPDADFSIPYDTVGVDKQVGFLNHSIDAYRYIWLFGDSTASADENPFHKYTKPGFYDVMLRAYTKKGCMDSLLIENAVFVSDEFGINFPTAFTPNGDGIFDYFEPVYNLIGKCTIEIYNRKGQLIFKTDDYANTFWDGTKNGKPLPTDTYVWRAVGQYKSGDFFEKTGNVTILR